jgi:phosphonate transport system ATP-binding protein
MRPAVSIDRLSKSFGDARALREVSWQVAAGEMVALLGASGSGKSTLLRHLSGLQLGDRPSGSIQIHGREVQAGGRLANDVRDIRSQVGLVFQQFNLVDRSTVLTNVLAGLLHRTPAWRALLHVFNAQERQSALAALDEVGILEHANKRASALSGGQQQRAAIARALVQKACIILADEPIASLDPESARKVMEILAAINREQNVTVIVSLHQVDYALKYCPRTVALRSGRVVFDGPSQSLNEERLRDLYGTDSELVVGHYNEQRAQAATARPVPPLARAA